MLAVKLDRTDEHNKDNVAEARTVLAFYTIGLGHKFKLSMQYPT
jgi:hypothetical protein